MKDYFKNLNTLTQKINRKIYKNKDARFIKIITKMGRNCWKKFFKKSNPLKITKDQVLKVEVSR